MPFQVSPGVNVSEIDLTTIVPAVSTTEGAIGGVFRWGPVGKTLLIDSEEKLALRYGTPTTFNAETFFTAANFLAYGNKLYVCRADAEDGGVGTDKTATAVDAGDITSIQADLYNEDLFFAAGLDKTDNASSKFAAKYPGALGNSIDVSVLFASDDDQTSNESVTSFETTILNGASGFINGEQLVNNFVASGLDIAPGANNGFFFIRSQDSAQSPYNLETLIKDPLASVVVGSTIRVGTSAIGFQTFTVTEIADGDLSAFNAYPSQFADGYGTDLRIPVRFKEKSRLSINTAPNTSGASTGVVVGWQYSGIIDSAPGQSAYQTGFGSNVQDEVVVVVTDRGGKITGVPGTVLETFDKLSRATDAKNEDGASLYWRDVINYNSAWVWSLGDINGVSGTSSELTAVADNNLVANFVLANGTDGFSEDECSISSLIRAYEPYRSTEDIDVSLILAGKARGAGEGAQMANWLIDNVAEYRKDCVVFISPEQADVVSNVFGDQSQDIVDFRNNMGSSSYGVLDSGYKYQYDKYNDVYRWIPLNGDVAGLAVRTDNLRDPWWSPAGFNRGQIKNIIRLAFNPAKAERDLLYKNGANPVCTFPGEGTVLYGDKTLLTKPSAFDRINVRRLFIVLEKAIATAAKYTLFEFNDEFTRAQFVRLVEPFLRDVQGRRGIYDFRVVCDESNNTPEVIDRNEFIGDIYIKPARSINFIQLNFIAVRTGVEFSEIVGKF